MPSKSKSSVKTADGEQQIAQHALTILVNLAADGDVLKVLATDDRFLDIIFFRILVRASNTGKPRRPPWRAKTFRHRLG